MYASSNKGVSFSVAGTPGSSSNPWTTNICRAAPGNEGHIWVPRIASGLKYSTNYGKTYSTVSNVTSCRAIGFGKAATGSQYPTIFIWGTVKGVTGLFRTTDKGANWLRLNDDAHQFGGFDLLVGDMNVFGRVYTAGGGIIYWDDQSSTGISDISVNSEKIDIYPNPSSSAFHIKMENPNQVDRIVVCDLMGRQVETLEKPQIKNEVTLGASLNSNIYVVRVIGESFSKSFKVIKK
jgi:hypothetical protein